jgi:Hpt domain
LNSAAVGVVMAEPLVDLTILNELERRLGRERVVRVVTVQMANGLDLVQRMRALEILPDPVPAKALAHQVAGSSACVGLLRLRSQATVLEHAPDDIEPVALAALVRALRDCLESSQIALRAEFPEA